MTTNYGLIFDNRFATLPTDFYTSMAAEGFAKSPFLIHLNQDMAEEIGLDPQSPQDSDFPAYFAGNKNLLGSKPVAMVYSGHQFGVWAGQLGDGRALLLGQVRGKNNPLWDIHLKGSGQTPYSRMGDGRAVLRSCIREYLCGEAMQGLGIPTTRSLCIIGSGEQVAREKWEPGAILTRLSPSHIRFGHFEHFFSHQRPDLIKLLADHVIQLYFDGKNYGDWFAGIVKRTARLMAQWQAVGFAHGVMNTDNMSILGLTLDYGPFGFMEAYDPHFICNHSDPTGRYAFDQQPAVAYWNLQVLGYVLQSLIPEQMARDILATFPTEYNSCYQELMTAKLGIAKPDADDQEIWIKLLDLMAKHKADYTKVFHILSGVVAGQDNAGFRALFQDKTAVQDWLNLYLNRMRQEAPGYQARMKKINPKYILRNWVAETAIRAAEDHQDYTVMDDLMKIFKNPYAEHAGMERFAQEAPQEMQDLCVSCSS